MKALKTICSYNGLFTGSIPNIETYEELKNGKRDWKPHIKPKLEAVTIPYELFVRLMNLDKRG